MERCEGREGTNGLFVVEWGSHFQHLRSEGGYAASRIACGSYPRYAESGGGHPVRKKAPSSPPLSFAWSS